MTLPQPFHLLFCTVLAALLVCSAGAQTTVPEAYQPPAPPAMPIAWTVRPPSTAAQEEEAPQPPKSQLTILGSVAFLGPEEYPLPEYIRKLYAESEHLIFESDFAAMQAAKFSSHLEQAMPLPDGQTLEQVVSSDLYQTLMERCERLNITPSALRLEGVKPWAAGLRVFSYANNKLGFEGRYAVDRALHTMASVDGKSISWLDSPETVLQLITHWPDGSPQEELVRQLLLEQQIIQQNLPELRGAWKTGNLPPLERHLLRAYAPFPTLRQRMVGSRTGAWAAQLTNNPPSKPTTLVLPLIYLVGEDGLLRELESAGNSVIRME